MIILRMNNGESLRVDVKSEDWLRIHGVGQSTGKTYVRIIEMDGSSTLINIHAVSYIEDLDKQPVGQIGEVIFYDDCDLSDKR